MDSALQQALRDYFVYQLMQGKGQKIDHPGEEGSEMKFFNPKIDHPGEKGSNMVFQSTNIDHPGEKGSNSSLIEYLESFLTAGKSSGETGAS